MPLRRPEWVEESMGRIIAGGFRPDFEGGGQGGEVTSDLLDSTASTSTLLLH